MISRTVLKTTISKITAFAGKVTSKKIALFATAFAAPIFTIITILDSIVSFGSLVYTLTWK